MGSGGKKGGGQTIGYKYHLGIDFAWCHAPADRFTAFWLDDREIYRGCFDDQDTIRINKPNIFGEAEGGIDAYVDAEFGAEDQTANTYTVSQTGSDTPAYRGITRTVFRGSSTDGSSRSAYVGNNPYLKRVTGELQRIYKRIVDGAVTDQWQSSIAGVPLIDPENSANFVSGTVADQSIFINVDLSSASNGYTGDDGVIIGNGLGVEDVKASIISSLIDIRDQLNWETEPTTDFLGDESNDSGLDIGIGYIRFTNGSQNNTSNNPNNVDPDKAPVPGVIGNSYDLPQRGWIMKENANRDDIDDLIAFVNDFVAVPDNYSALQDRNLMELFYNNINEAFGSLSTSNSSLRGLVTYSALVTDETDAEVAEYAELIDNVLNTNSGSDAPFKSLHGPDLRQYNGESFDAETTTLGTNDEGSGDAAAGLTNPTDASKFDIQTGEWYVIDISEGGGGVGPLYSDDLLGSGGYEVGDTTLTGNPAGSPANKLWRIPRDGSQLWYWGPAFRDDFIYAGNYNITHHYQRDVTGPTTLSQSRDGVDYDFRPWNNTSDKFTVDYSTTDGGNVGVWLKNLCSGYVEMNPAHIIRECLTDQQWGLGLAQSEIDETSFAAAANTLYTERFGLSMAWTRETPIEDFINVILNHIDAVLYVDRSDGLWHLTLIRDDYDPETLDEYTDADVVSWDNVSIKSPAELTNTVTIKYNSRDLDGPASLTVHNLAQIQKLGKKVHTTVNYPGIWQDTLATRVAQRDLITLSTSLIAGEVELTRKAYDLVPGDVFKLTSSRYNLSGEVMRVVEVNVGDGRENSVRVKFTQDKYNFDYSEETDLVNTPETEWEDPTGGDPETVDDRIVTEEPYYLFVQRNGEILAEEIETREKDIGYPFVSANPPTSQSTYARIRYDDGGGYVNGSQVSYGTYATLSAELVEEADDTTVTMSGVKFLTDASVNDLIQIDDEIMRIDSIDSSTQLTVARGALDTVPDYHPANSPIFFLDNSNIIRGEYVASDTVDIKLLDSTTGNQLDAALAPVDTVTLASRITGPYPAGQLQLDGAYSGVWSYDTGSTVEATWVHRDRTQQNTATPPAHTDAEVGPETDVNYTITAIPYDYFGDEIVLTSGLFETDKDQNTSETINTDNYSPSSEGTEPWSAVGVQVLVQREDSTSVVYDNWQTAEVIAYTEAEPNDLLGYYTSSWIDANDTSSLFQDFGKTTAASSDGDPVAYAGNQKDRFIK